MSDETTEPVRVVCPHSYTVACRECRPHEGWGAATFAIARPVLENIALEKAEAENARLRERLAVLTKALRTVAECRGGGAWYCKSGVADAALSQADETGGAR